MKITLMLLVVAVSAVIAAPVDEASTKEKRGLSLGLGYHAPLITHSHYVAPAVVHSAPLYHAPIITHHAPIVTHHAPLIAHAPISTYHLPSYHSYHHFK